MFKMLVELQSSHSYRMSQKIKFCAVASPERMEYALNQLPSY